MKLPAHTGDDDIERDCPRSGMRIRSPSARRGRVAGGWSKRRVNIPANRGGRAAAAAQDGAVGHRFGPSAYSSIGTGQFTGRQAADDRRTTSRSCRALAGRQQPLHAADRPEAPAPRRRGRSPAADLGRVSVAEKSLPWRSMTLDDRLVVDQRRQRLSPLSAVTGSGSSRSGAPRHYRKARRPKCP